jgi:thiosulfate/3-mercaptopyruvate sulfurtransferase
LDKHDIVPEKTVICSCGTGREATNEFILFKWYLGFPKVKIYEGSFTEWSSYPQNPTVIGPNPR